MKENKHGDFTEYYRKMSNYEYLEKSEKFRAFLIAFGVKGIEEFRTFTDEQKRICFREYLKDLGRKH